MTRTKLKTVETLSVARQALADVIERRHSRAEVLKAFAAAAAEMRTEAAETRQALTTAEQALVDAQQRGVDDRIAKHLGRGSRPGVSVIEARQAVEALKETIDGLDAARSQLEPKLERAKLDLADTGHALQLAIGAVVADETAALAREFWAVRNRYATLEHLFRHVLLGLGVEERRCTTNPAIDPQVAASWKAALAALETDASADLP